MPPVHNDSTGGFPDSTLLSFQCPPVDDIGTTGAVQGVRDTVWDQIQLAVPSNPKLTKDSNTDVVVVGAGIAGLSVAYNLAKAGKNSIRISCCRYVFCPHHTHLLSHFTEVWKFRTGI